MNEHDRALACINQIDPRDCTYDEWLRVGMALESAGCSARDWEAWSARDPNRYHAGECEEKWKSFRGGHGHAVTIASLVDMVKAVGGKIPPSTQWDFDGAGGFGWDDPLVPTSARAKRNTPPAPEIVDQHYVVPDDIPAPAPDWNTEDLVRYLELVYQTEDLVGYVTEAWFDETKQQWVPKKGVCDRTAGQLIEAIRKCGGDLGAVIGDANPDVGAWIRPNPLDGHGVRDENVTAFRHALLEADEDDIGRQLAIIRQMEVPCSAIVHSGGKSIHAIVRVDAASYEEYRKRVDFLYRVAERNGLKVDQQNRNPSRLSRMPGILRKGKPQYLISGHCGQKDWDAWNDFVENRQDDLGMPEALDLSVAAKVAPALISGILRVGHKMLLTGPSKAGKSFELIELSEAIATGSTWHEWECRQGPVLYLNTELDSESCKQRFRDVADASGIPYAKLKAIHVWNLRGKAPPLDRLAEKVIRKAQAVGYAAIIIDPIYKVMMGDENSAEDIIRFCNQIDRICTVMNCAVIYCHHHSKGTQGQKRSIDRAAGSGVFGRDTDASLDLIELDISKERRAQLENKMVCEALADVFSSAGLPLDKIDVDTRGEAQGFLQACQMEFSAEADMFRQAAVLAREKTAAMTGWRIEATLREFRTPEQRRFWFDWPIHKPDPWGLLLDAKAAGEEPPWVAQQAAKEAARKTKAQEMKSEIEEAIKACGGPGEATIKAIAESTGLSDDQVRRRIKKHTRFDYKNGMIIRSSAKGSQ